MSSFGTPTRRRLILIQGSKKLLLECGLTSEKLNIMHLTAQHKTTRIRSPVAEVSEVHFSNSECFVGQWCNSKVQTSGSNVSEAALSLNVHNESTSTGNMSSRVEHKVVWKSTFSKLYWHFSVRRYEVIMSPGRVFTQECDACQIDSGQLLLSVQSIGRAVRAHEKVQYRYLSKKVL